MNIIFNFLRTNYTFADGIPQVNPVGALTSSNSQARFPAACGEELQFLTDPYMKAGSTPTMFEIDKTIISADLVEKKFACDLEKCKGYCCVHGESGAPLEFGEVGILRDIYPRIKEYLRKEGIEAIDTQGTSVIDKDNESVTPLIGGEECAYAIFENGIARCGIEKAFENNATDFRKPLSCHLYPVRIKQLNDFEALNYDRWSICEPARESGLKENMPVFRFVRDAIIRKYGAEYFEKLEIVKKEFVAGHDVL